jgi:serine/threonine-protein kinase ULK/ATG1
MASLKLFGSPTENIWLRKRSHRIPVPRSISPKMLEPEEERLLSLLEDVAQKATVIFDFADSKFFLMAELAASGSMKASIASPFGNGITAAQLQRRSSSASERSPSSPSPLGQASSSSGPPAGTEAKYAVLVGETLVLYIKALAFLDKGIVLSRNFWSRRGHAGQGTTADFNDCKLERLTIGTRHGR